jgi:hypothetical protein
MERNKLQWSATSRLSAMKGARDGVTAVTCNRAAIGAH